MTLCTYGANTQSLYYSIRPIIVIYSLHNFSLDSSMHSSVKHKATYCETTQINLPPP